MSTLGYELDVAERMAFIDPQGGRLTLTNEFSRQVLFGAIRQHRATIAILDPLVALHDADENSNSAMRAVLDTLNPIIEGTGCAVILAHHEPKSPESNNAAARGASSIRDWCRTMLRLTAQKKGADGSQRFQLDLDKANYGGSVWQLILERKQDSYLFTAVELEAAVNPRDLWDLLGRDGGWFDDIQEQIMERFDVSKATAYRALKKAEELKIVEIGERVNPESKRKKSYLTRGTGPEGKE
jgi:RecA-family ATPase